MARCLAMARKRPNSPSAASLQRFWNALSNCEADFQSTRCAVVGQTPKPIFPSRPPKKQYRDACERSWEEDPFPDYFTPSICLIARIVFAAHGVVDRRWKKEKEKREKGEAWDQGFEKLWLESKKKVEEQLKILVKLVESALKVNALHVRTQQNRKLTIFLRRFL